ncbi:MAG: hypothetical protein ACI9AD_000904 [Nitriliruptoraceae bacterium]|jgi:hypothetical protein
MRLARPLVALAALVGLAAVPVVAPSSPMLPELGALGGACVTDVADAATLVTDLPADLPLRSVAGGMPVTIVTDPLVAPGIPYALLDTGVGLCTIDSFNLTVAAALGGPAAVATAFASTAGMPWLGDVAVHGLAVNGETVTLSTFGGRHNVSSDWTITIDARGVRDARFETIAFATDLHVGDVADLEGVTSRPGHSRSWVRDANGMLSINATISDDLMASYSERDAAVQRAANVAGLAPGDFLERTFSDGQTVKMSFGVAATPVETPVTGVAQADRLTHLFLGLSEIYEDFQSWGMSDPWDEGARTYFGFNTIVPDDAGYINISSGLSAYCLACAFLNDTIEVHAEYAFPEIAQQLVGVSYPDADDFFVGVMGHELVHSMQGGYSDGEAGSLSTSFTEGTARASEGLYDLGEDTYQDGSIAYVDNGNGCEGFENGRGGWINAQAAGPFLGHTYDACYFWWSYYAQYGGPGLVALLEALPVASSASGNAADRNLILLDAASPVGDGTLDLAYWAAAYTAGSSADGFTFADATGDVHDWHALLTPAQRSSDLGLSANVTVADGGTMGFRVTRSGVLTAVPDGAELFLFEVSDNELRRVGPAAVGAAVAVGQILTVVAATTGSVSGTITITVG